MNKKDYKGYELIKAIHDGEIKDCTIIEVHDLSTLDHIKARITYSNKRLNWIAGDFDTGCLFDNNIYFRILEDNTEDIEETENNLEGFKEFGEKLGKIYLDIIEGFKKAFEDELRKEKE